MTYENVLDSTLLSLNSFQIEIFFDGTLSITHLTVDAFSGLVGLSDGGGGVPPDFLESDLSGYAACEAASVPALREPGMILLVLLMLLGGAWAIDGGRKRLDASRAR